MLKYALSISPLLTIMHRKILCASVDEPLVVYKPYSIRSILFEIGIIHIYMNTLEEYLQQLKREQTDEEIDGQTNNPNS